MVDAVTALPATVPTVPETPAPMNPYDTASKHMGTAGDVYSNFATGGALTNINNYLNPYYEQVINRTLGRMETDRNKSLNLIGDNAAAAGAFGGSRHGLMEGEFLGQYNQNVGDTTAQLLQQGYNNAQQAALADAGIMMGGAGSLAGLGQQYYGIGNDIADRQMQAGTMQQQLMQMLLTGGAQQYQALVNSPNQMLSLFQALAGADPRNQSGSASQSTTPGLFDYLSLAAGVAGAGLEGGAWG